VTSGPGFDPARIAYRLRERIGSLVAGEKYLVDGTLVEIGLIDRPPDLSQMGVQMVSDVEKPIVKTVAVEPEPTVKESLTVAVEEIADTYERVQQIVVVTDDSGDEALYLDGVLKAWDSTIYACDIAAIAGDAVVTISHTNAGRTLSDWPKKLSDVFASNNPEIPDSSDSSLDIGELERCEATEAPEPRKRVLYIAGPMRGIAWFNYPLFDRVAKELRDAGNEVISPADEDRKVGFDPFANPEYRIADACTFPSEASFESFDKTVRRCFESVLRCDEIVLLPGWEKSQGALAELAIAAWMGKRVWQGYNDEQGSPSIKFCFMDNRGLAFSLSEFFWPNAVVSHETQKFIRHFDEKHKDDEDILDKAARITRGDRQASYGPPDQDFRRTAGMWSALFGCKLKDGVTFEPRDVALAMILLKTSRETHQRKRDNWVDIAGYASCGSQCN
jgi:hypothetical protein